MNLNYKEFAARYCERQVNTPKDLYATLEAQQRAYQPDGWMLLECQDLASSRGPSISRQRPGQYVILPYGPKNTFKEPPTGLISPRGLASDMSVVVATLKSEDLKWPS
jgi:hypothetical protein